MNSRTYFYSILVAALIFWPGTSSRAIAQDSTRYLTLNDAIDWALKSNKGIQLAKLDEAIAIAKYQQTEAIFLPQADLSYSAMSTNNPLNAFGFKLQQRAITENDFNAALLNHPSARPDFMTKLEIEQPLIYIHLLYMRKSAEKQTEVYKYKTQRTQEYLTYEVTKAYLQLQLAYEAVKVLIDARETAKSVYSFTDNHFKQGLIQKSDLLNAQVHVTSIESNLAKAQSNIRNASGYLGFLMGQPAAVVYKTRDEIHTSLPGAEATQISASRSDFMAMKKAIETSGLMIKSSRMSYLPRLNAFTNYQYNDHHFAGFGASAYMFGFKLSWNVFNGNKTKYIMAEQKLEQDKMALQLSQQKEQSQLDLDKAYRDLSDARVEMEKEKLAIEQAAEALRITLNRYEQGLVHTTDVLTADTQLSQLKFSLTQVQFTANVVGAYIQFLTSTTTK